MKEFVRLTKKYHPLMTTAAPTQYMRLLKEEGAKDLGIIGGSGSMALAPKTQTGFEEKTKSVMVEGYGLSEFAPVTHGTLISPIVAILGSYETVGKLFHLLDRVLKTPGILPLLRMSMKMIGARNIGALMSRLIRFASSNILTTSSSRAKEMTASIGTPFVDMKMKVVDEDTGETIPMEKVVKEHLRGEMCLDGPQKMLGYYKDTRPSFDEEGYVYTGDVITVDEWGRVFIVDRTKDMVNVSGYKVYTREIDDILYEIPGVDEAARIGYPDPERPGSERLKVFVVTLPEYRGKIKEEDVIDYLR